MRTALLLALVATSALAEPAGTPRSRSVSLSTTDATAVHMTTGALTLYVDPTGNDGNSCIATGTGACLTIQGALNKAPKLLRHQVTISVAAGTYAGFVISGFTQDMGFQQSSGGLIVDGALATSTLATGSATGTALGAGQLAGSGATFGVLCDSGATWTVNDLRGRFITTASPTNTALVISANTATCITVVGTWSLPVSAQTTYTIQDPSVVVNTAVAKPATPLAASTSNYAAVVIIGNGMNYLNRAIALRSLKLTNSSGDGIRFEDISAVEMQQMQIKPTGTSKLPIVAATAVPGSGAVSLGVVRSYLLGPNDNSGLQQSGGTLTMSNSLLFNSFGGDLAAVQLVNGRLGTFSGNEVNGWTIGVSIANGGSSTTSGSQTIVNSRLVCRSHAGSVGLWMGYANSTTALGGFATTTLATTDISVCEVGLQAVGSGLVDVTSVSGSASITGFAGFLGGTMMYTRAGMTLTAGTNEIDLDNGGATALFTDVAAAKCLLAAQSTSKVCAR